MDKPKKVTKKDIAYRPDNHMVIRFGYNSVYVVDYKLGLILMESLLTAEELNTTDYDNNTIIPIRKENKPTFEIMSHREYVNKKMSNLLGVKVGDNDEPPF